MNRNKNKLLALTLALALPVSFLAACGTTQKEKKDTVSTAEIDAIAQAASSLLPSHGSTEGKEETVYVIADAAGAPQRTIVSAWLKNPEETDTITDRAELSNIQNVKGDESYTVAGDGSLIWDAQGRDIYYQGDSQQELPLAVHIDYRLDGREVTPEELAGASGRLEMTFSYENKASRQEKIGGKDVTIYQPFVVVSCLVLDASKASAVEVSNGTLINSGEQMIVAGMAMPGLKESLGLEELKDADGKKLDADLPETVTISADVTDFSLLTTVTLVENALLSDLDLENVDSFEELKSSVNELTDASAQLVNGAGSLYDGTRSLSGGTGALVNGAVELDAGARTVASNMGDLYQGLLSLKEGAGSLKDGLGTLSDSAPALTAGMADLQAGAHQLSDSFPALKEGADALTAGLSQVSAGAAGIQAGADQLSEKLGEAGEVLTEALTAIGGNEQQAAGLLAAYMQSHPDGDENGELSAVLGLLGGNAETFAAVSGLGDQMKEAQAALADISAGAGNIAGSTGEGGALGGGAASLSGGIGQAAGGAGSLAAGADTLSEKAAALPGGMRQLYDGAAELEQGVSTAAAGAGQLCDGANALAAGAGELKGGAQSLSGGVAQVMEGASALLSGMSKFDTDGVKVLSQLFEDDAQGFMDRLRALQDYGREYDNFSGLAEGMPGMVRFIIRTDSIGE